MKSAAFRDKRILVNQAGRWSCWAIFSIGRTTEIKLLYLEMSNQDQYSDDLDEEEEEEGEWEDGDLARAWNHLPTHELKLVIKQGTQALETYLRIALGNPLKPSRRAIIELDSQAASEEATVRAEREWEMVEKLREFTSEEIEAMIAVLDRIDPSGVLADEMQGNRSST